MSNKLLRVLSLVAILGVSACASSSNTAADAAPKPGRIIPPRIQNAGTLRFTTNSRTFNFRIEVPVDEEGRADATGMRVMGNMANVTREEIISWLSRATFYPARQDGVPVRGTFRMDLQRR